MKEFKKIIECIEQIQKEKQKKELSHIKQIKKFCGYVWNGNEYELKDGTKRRFDKLTERQTQKTIKEQKEILTKKAIKKNETETAKKIAYIKELEETEPAKKIEIIVNWSCGGAYGWQAYAELRTETARTWNTYEGQRTSGCGYDKRSTATASVLNKSKEIFVIIAEKLEKLPKKQIKEYLTRKKSGCEFIGYGFDFWGGAFGSFSGGVGFECHRNNLKSLGFECITYFEGKQEDFYQFTKNEKKGRATK